MQGAGRQFLAHTGFAFDQHINIGLGDGLQAAAIKLGGGGVAQDADLLLATGLQAPPQQTIFQNQAPLFTGPLHHLQQPVLRTRFFDKVIGPQGHGLNRHRDIAMAGQQNNRQIRIAVLDRRKQVKAAHSRHPQITQHNTGPLILQQADGRVGRGGHHRLQPRQLQALAQRIT